MGRFLISVYDWFVSLFCLSYFGIGGFIYGIVTLPFWLLMPRRAGAKLGRWALHWLFRKYLFLLRLSGRITFDTDQLKELNGQPSCIISPNHPGLMDAVVIMAQVSNAVCVAKAGLWNNPALMGGIRLARFIPNHNPTQLVKDAVKEVRSGTHLILFPEGTRTITDTVNEFRPLAALVAKKAEVPIRPVFLDYFDWNGKKKGFLGKRWKFFGPCPVPVHIRVRVGEPLSINETDDVKVATERLEDVFHEKLRTN